MPQNQRQVLEDELDLLITKQSKLRRARAIENDAATKFKLDNQIEEVEAEIKKLEAQLSASANSPNGTASAFRSNLPNQAYFVGREKELQIIADAIAPQARTWGALIDGPGGIGKTALAVRAGYVAPAEHFERKIFLSAKVRELTPAGEVALEDYMLPNYMALLTELARELGDADIEKMPPNDRAKAVQRRLSDRRVLLIIDNLETFDEKERLRLFQFLSRLPAACKAIVTSRRRTDIDARVVRLDRLTTDDALNLIAELAKNNPNLARVGEDERRNLYEMTHGNPLLLKWTAGQLGRGHCRTVAEACAFLKAAPPDNDPLEYIFGDLLDTFSDSELKVLIALTFFTQPAEVKWLADLGGLAEPQARTALEDLADRALLLSDPEERRFMLPPLAAVFLRRKRAEVVKDTGDRLADRAYALALENGYDKYERFPVLEAEWPTLRAAMPLLVQGKNYNLQHWCRAVGKFLEFFGHWDERLILSLQAEERAVVVHDFDNAGWRASQTGFLQAMRGQAAEVLVTATRVESYWKRIKISAQQKGIVLRLRGIGHKLEKNYPAALATFQEMYKLYYGISPENKNMAIALSDLAGVKREYGDYNGAEQDYREALYINKKVNNIEGVTICVGCLAQVAFDRQQYAEAEQLSTEALALAQKINRKEEIARESHRLAKAILHQGRPAEALPNACRAIAIMTELRSPYLAAAQETLAECEAVQPE